MTKRNRGIGEPVQKTFNTKILVKKGLAANGPSTGNRRTKKTREKVKEGPTTEKKQLAQERGGGPIPNPGQLGGDPVEDNIYMSKVWSQGGK